MKDPHASLSLFEPPPSEDTEVRRPIAPKGNTKQPGHHYSELFVGGNDPDTTPTESAPPSPRKVDESGKPIAPKVGAGKNFKPLRLFGEEGDEEPSQPERPVKVDPRKYSHFEFGEAPLSSVVSTNNADRAARASRHLSQWDFEDFVTPEKPRQRVRGQDVRHFGFGEDDVANQEEEKKNSQRTRVNPRRDQETHFEFRDDSSSPGEKLPSRPKGALGNKGMGLYNNNLFDESGMPPVEEEQKASIINGNYRRKDFDSHWSMEDPPSPSAAAAQGNGNHHHSSNGNSNGNGNTQNGGEHSRAVKMMNSNWSAYEPSPDEQPIPAPTFKPTRASRNVNSQRSWTLGDEGF